jgi:hypothetical protein
MCLYLPDASTARDVDGRQQTILGADDHERSVPIRSH